ncbi:MAG TPA: hypothetical protein VMI35_15605, partial [Puia sp.]|nr:hypothetical protein [Puia sp.]
MEGKLSGNPTENLPAPGRNYFYPISVITLMLLLPVASILTEILFVHAAFGWQLIGKWFLFW